MFKKLFIVAVAIGAGLFLVNTTHLGSYARTAFRNIKKTACDQVPLEFEIERVKNEVSQLVPDMRKHLSSIAEEMVAVDNLREDVKSTHAELDNQKHKILALKSDVENAKGIKVVYDGREFPVSRLRDKLTREWQAYKRCEEGLKSKEKLLEAKEESLAVAREQLSSMRTKKEQLEVEIARLEAEMKNIRLAQTKSNFQLDDSRLARINATLSGIKNRLKVEQNELTLRGQFGNDLDIPVEKKVQTAEVIKEIDNYFGKTEKAEVVEK